MGNGGSQQGVALARDDLWGEEEEEGERLESRGGGRDGERGKPLGFLGSVPSDIARLLSWNACKGKRRPFLCVLN